MGRAILQTCSWELDNVQVKLQRRESVKLVVITFDKLEMRNMTMNAR